MIGFRVRNIGTQPSGTFHIKVEKGPLPNCTWDVPSLAPGASFQRGPGVPGSKCSGIFGIPSASPPGYNATFTVDDTGAVAETNEGNNVLSDFISVN